MKSSRHIRLGGLEPLQFNGDTSQTLPFESEVQSDGSSYTIPRTGPYPDDVLHWASRLCLSVRDPPAGLDKVLNLALLMMDGRAVLKHNYSGNPEEREMFVNVPELLGNYRALRETIDGEFARVLIWHRVVKIGDFVELYRVMGIEDPHGMTAKMSSAWALIHDNKRLFELAVTLNPPEGTGWTFWCDPEADELRKGAFGDDADSTTGGMLVGCVVRSVRLGWANVVKECIRNSSK